MGEFCEGVVYLKNGHSLTFKVDGTYDEFSNKFIEMANRRKQEELSAMVGIGEYIIDLQEISMIASKESAERMCK